MKITLLSDRIPPENVGGAGKAAWNLAVGLQQAGHDVHMIAATEGQPFEEARDGIMTYHLHAHYPGRWQAWLSLYNPQTIRPLRALLQRIRPDVLNGHNIHRDLSYAAFSVAHGLRIPAVFTSPDGMPFAYTKYDRFIDRRRCGVLTPDQYRLPPLFNARQMRLRYNPLRNLTIRRILRDTVQARTCASEAHRQCLEANGLPPFRVVYNGIDPLAFDVFDALIESLRERFDLAGRRVILFAGRLSIAKGSEQLLEALLSVVQAVPETLLLVLSPRPLECPHPKYQVLFDRHMRSGGWLSGAELAAAFHVADVITVPSIIMDCAPLTALETMAAHKSLIATCYGGSPEMVSDGETGYIVNPFDTAVFAERLIRLLRDPALCAQMGNAGRQRLEDHFTLTAQTNAMLKVYADAIGKG